MKLQPTKKLFAFIIMMMFFGLTQFAFAQKKQCNPGHACPSGYECINGQCSLIFCNCSLRLYGCTTSACEWYCSRIGQCGTYLNAATKETSFEITYHFDSPAAIISFSLSQSAKVALQIFDVNGILVKTLADEIYEKGEHELQWSTEEINAGTYILQFDTDNYSETKRLSVTK